MSEEQNSLARHVHAPHTWPMLPCVPVVDDTFMMQRSFTGPSLSLSFRAASRMYGAAACNVLAKLSISLESMAQACQYYSSIIGAV